MERGGTDPLELSCNTGMFSVIGCWLSEDICIWQMSGEGRTSQGVLLLKNEVPFLLPFIRLIK
jgi:hypothetical protein